jgi:hypothetical protein
MRRKARTSIDDVIPTIDIENAARDQLGAIECEECGCLADIVDADQAARRRLPESRHRSMRPACLKSAKSERLDTVWLT